MTNKSGNWVFCLLVACLLWSTQAKSQYPFSQRFGFTLQKYLFYDSGQYQFFKTGQSTSSAVSINYQFNFSNHFSSFNEVSFAVFNPFNSMPKAIQANFVKTAIKAYAFKNTECSNCRNKRINPYLSIGFQYSKIQDVKPYKFTSQTASAGAEFNIYGETRLFTDFGYQLGLGYNARNARTLSFGMSYNFKQRLSEKISEETVKLADNLAACQKELNYLVEKKNAEYKACLLRIQMLEGNLIELNEFTDSLLLAKQKNNIHEFNLDSISKAIVSYENEIEKLKSAFWKDFTLGSNSGVVLKSGFYAVLKQLTPFDQLDSIHSLTSAEYYYVIVNPFGYRRVIYYLGPNLDATEIRKSNLILSKYSVSEFFYQN